MTCPLLKTSSILQSPWWIAILPDIRSSLPPDRCSHSIDPVSPKNLCAGDAIVRKSAQLISVEPKYIRKPLQDFLLQKFGQSSSLWE